MTTALARTGETRATLTLGDEQIAVRLDGDGYLSRVQRRIRLYYGPHLYAACRPGAEQADTKVTPYQPGYMMLVEAMGGILVVPPVVQATEEDGTRKPRPNPTCHTDPRSGITYRVEATAVCLLRHPVTGQVVPSAGPTSVVDARQTLLQGLLKMTAGDRQDVARMVPDDLVDELRKGECKGWGVTPLGGGISVVYNLSKAGVRDVVQDYLHLCGTIRQRAVSKAERLAADHHPLLRGRCSWRWDQLRQDGPRRYVEISTVSWVETAGRFDRQAIMTSLERMGADADVQTVVEEPIDLDLTDPDADVEPGETLRIAQEPDPIPEPAPREAVKVEAKPEPRLEQRQPPEERRGNGYASPDLLRRIADIEADMSEGAIEAARKAAGLPTSAPLTTSPRAAVLAYLAAIS